MGNRILIKSRERETGIAYSFFLNEEDGRRILEIIEGEEVGLSIGYAYLKDGKIWIRSSGAPAILEKREVFEQIRKGLNGYPEE